MARIFITGSSDGLGRAAAERLLEQGHDVVVHARNERRAGDLGELGERAAGVLVGDLGSTEETKALAEAANALGRMDAVIHNAGLGNDSTGPVLAVNVVAPYLLTALMERPERLVYLSSGMHRDGSAEVARADWGGGEGGVRYWDSKLAVAGLALAVARLWPGVRSNAVDPGWVRTKTGGASAPGTIENGIGTQVWLAGDPAAAGETGGYWHNLRREEPHQAVADPGFQEELLASLAEYTGVTLPR